MSLPLEPLIAAVQTNCHIADARHAADLTLCTYLLQMREFYRWERGLPLGAALSRDEVGTWLAAREATWSELEGRDFVALPLGGPDAATPDRPSVDFDPFDLAGVNAQLLPRGWVYGAGLAGPERPGFFLARLDRLEQRDKGLSIQVCGQEHARGLFAPPAALQTGTIVLRRESLARWLWEKFESFSLKRNDGAFKAFADAYGLEDDFHAALPRMLDDLGELLILHELGEHQVGQSLEPGWGAMRLALHSRRADLHVRAVRDHLADLQVTLPALVRRGDPAPLHFWFSNYDGVRSVLFPSLPQAYDAWCRGDEGQALIDAAQAGASHFTRLAGQVLALHAQHGDRAGPPIEALLTDQDSICRH